MFWSGISKVIYKKIIHNVNKFKLHKNLYSNYKVFFFEHIVIIRLVNKYFESSKINASIVNMGGGTHIPNERVWC